jgi:hypothetical protein
MTYRFSATNACHLYKLTLADQGNYLSGWPLNDSLNTEHVWDGIVISALLEDHARQGTLLQVPHTGTQADRLKQAMRNLNTRIALNGQPYAVCHACDKCMRIYDLENGESRTSNPLVGNWARKLIYKDRKSTGNCS